MKPSNLKRTLVIDAAIAAALVGTVLIIAPGLAVVGMLALLVLVVGGIGFLIEVGTARGRPKFRVRDGR